MDAKKSLPANLETQKDLFLMLGFVLVLGLIFISFEWSKKSVKLYDPFVTNMNFEEETDIVQTISDPVPPPPAPEPAALPDLVIVEKPIETETNMFNSEVKTNDPPIVKPVNTGQFIDNDDEVIFTVVETDPIFPGGIGKLYEDIAKNIAYPTKARELGIKGRVVTQFVINKDGSIEDIQVVKGVDSELDEEAVRVIQLLPKWTPAKQNGKAVRFRFTLPIKFTIATN